MPSSKEIEIVLKNPLEPNKHFSYYIDVEDSDFNSRWLDALEQNLKANLHLEKNYCFLGWPDTQRTVDYLCDQINEAISQINTFNATRIWQDKGLKPYHIDKTFTPQNVIHKGEAGRGKPGLKIEHDMMNWLHRYFEDLQGEAWGLSQYYKFADYETKYAIRQLNVLCHELESLVMSLRKKVIAPEWQRPSQITTFLNAPRHDLQESDYNLFLKNRYDRVLGGVYLHWAQIGKTQYEVFRDEDGKDIDEATCSSINSLKFYSGEFDIEWGRDVTEETHDWHAREQKQFKQWLARNGFDWNDPKCSLGYIKIGQVNLKKSFGTEDFFTILEKMSDHLDIHKIITPNTERTYNYVWSDPKYKQMQIDFLKPGYDWSKANV